MNTYTAEDATKHGYRAMTIGYDLQHGEEWMLNNVLADMRRGKIQHVLVKVGDGVEVWRK